MSDKKIVEYIPLFLSFLILLVLILPSSSMPLFSDGATHAYIIREISKTGFLPLRDPIGTTVSGFSATASGERPFMYPPLFYSLGSVLNVFINDELVVLMILNIIPIFLIFLVFFKLNEGLFGYKIAAISTIFLILTSEWLWFIYHRLQEPLLFFIILLLLYLSVYYFHQTKDKPLRITLLCTIFSVALISLKQTTLPFVFAIMGYFLLKNRKIGTYIILLTILMVIPSFAYIYQATGTLSPTGTTQILDAALFHPWWAWDKAEWEISLDNEIIDNQYLSSTYDQYLSYQPSFSRLIQQKEYFALFGNILSYHPIHYKLFRGFHSPNSSSTYPIFLFLFTLGFIIFLRKMIENGYNSFFLVLVLLTFSTYLIWFVTDAGTVRYFTYVAVIFTFIYGISTHYITTLFKSKIAKCIFLIVIIVSLTTNIVSEYERDLNYKNTLGHQFAGEDALISLVEASKVYENYSSRDAPIFTPMPEVAYYFDRQIIWDHRLFFLPKEQLEYYLSYYNFTLVIVPSYSGKAQMDDWTYAKAIPKDSAFNHMLTNQNYFVEIADYHTFKIYKRNESIIQQMNQNEY